MPVSLRRSAFETPRFGSARLPATGTTRLARAPQNPRRASNFCRRLRPHQHEHALAAREQPFDEVAADESGRAGDEIRHVLYCNPMIRETERMSAVDAAWLRMDRPTNLMMIVGVVVFDSRVDFRRFRRTIRRPFPRLRPVPLPRAAGRDDG